MYEFGSNALFYALFLQQNHFLRVMIVGGKQNIFLSFKRASSLVKCPARFASIPSAAFLERDEVVHSTECSIFLT
jgi:hypothetical protein